MPLQGLAHQQPSLIDYVAQQEALPHRRVVHTHEQTSSLSLVVVEIDCSSRREAMLLAQRVGTDAGTDEHRATYGHVTEIAYYEGT